MIVDAGRFSWRTAFAAAPASEHVDDIIMWAIELALGKIRNQVLISSVAIDDDNLLASIASHLIRGFLKQAKLQLHAVGHRAGLVLRLENLPEVIFRKNHSVLL